MACPAIITGTKFLGSTLAHIDCQSQIIGSYGYGALADPGSAVSIALAALLTVFIALWGVRLLLGSPIEGRDVVGEVMKIGIVLTLATSWPAWRVVGYDLVMNAPAETAQTVAGAAALPASGSVLVARLQNADDGLVTMTILGTGRLTGGVVGGSDLGDQFHGIALADETGFGWGRIFYLAGTIGPYAVVHLGAGIFLALAPFMTTLFLFGGTASLFFGWLRGLAFCAIGAFALALIQGVELAILDPWISDVLAQRGAGTFTPSAPTEFIVLSLAFVVLAFGALLLSAWIVFFPHLVGARNIVKNETSRSYRREEGPQQLVNTRAPAELPSRAHIIADAVATTMRREEGSAGTRHINIEASQRQDNRAPSTLSRVESQSTEILGSGFRRRRHGRTSRTATTRDLRA